MRCDSIKTCAICPSKAVASKKDAAGFVHRACAVHSPHLAGWVRDSNAESRADSRASRDYESRAYGDD